MYYKNSLALIGNTPVVEVKAFDVGPCRLFLKLENQNPGGSIKDRVAKMMIEEAEKSGEIKKGQVLIEATAGNTGLGLALIASQKGYPLKLVIPDKMSIEKIAHLKALGAEVIMTRSDVLKGHEAYYQDYALRLAQEIPNSYYLDQFNNPNNPKAHELTTGPELWEQMHKKIDAIVLGVGSSGTLKGLTNYFRDKNVTFVLGDPVGSILKDYYEKKEYSESGQWLVEGIGEDFVPNLWDETCLKNAYSISDQEAFLIVRKLLREEGILAGSSTGVLIGAAMRYGQAQSSSKTIVTFVCDSGSKYFSKMYNDSWMEKHGFIE